MSSLSPAQISELLIPYYPDPSEQLAEQLSVYLELLLRWNARTNLSAIRDPAEIVTRHFGESLFLAAHLPATATSLLDLGSGAGFPGLPVQLSIPALQVTLAESQHKKAAFLREVVRTLSLPTEVWAGRVEDLRPERTFDVVALRAVDNPDLALNLARNRLAPNGIIAHLTSKPVTTQPSIPLPNSTTACLQLLR